MLYAFRITGANHAVLTLQNGPTGQTMDIPLAYYPNTPTALEEAVSSAITAHGWYFEASQSEIDWEFKRQEKHAEHLRQQVWQFGD